MIFQNFFTLVFPGTVYPMGQILEHRSTWLNL